MMDNNSTANSRPNAMLSAGQNIGHYKILGELGSGGMGSVYLALDTKLNRKAAIKLLSQTKEIDADAISLFISESQAQASVSHPNIATIYEINECEDGPFIAMEYVEGTPLKTLMAQKRIEFSKTIQICIQVCEGLEKAHQAGYYHGDIKPGNIIVDPEGFAKILDFGLAGIIGGQKLYSIDPMSGTLGYISPEQLQEKTPDQRADIFSLGVVLYEMLAGKLPFRGEYEAAIIYSIVNEEPVPITVENQQIPVEIQAIISRALQKNPDHRYQSASEMASALKALLDDKAADKAVMASKNRQVSSVAVLRFADISPGRDQEYFCDGICEEIIGALSKVSGIRIASRTSSFRFAGQELDIREIGKKLGVDSVLEGSIHKVGDRLRINARLVNISDGYCLWSESFDRNLEDVFDVQDEISRKVADKLRDSVENQSPAPLVYKFTDNIEAYNQYLRGRYYWNRRYEGGLQKSILYFQKAIDYDPLSARAYAGLADSFNIIAFYNFMPPGEVCPRAKSAAAKALELAPDLAEAHTAMGWVKTFYDWDWKTAELEFKQAIKLNKNYAIAHHYYALFLLSMRRSDEGLAEMRIALSLDPLATIIGTSLGAAYYFTRNYAQSIVEYLKALEFDPDFAIAHAFLAGPYVCLGQYERAEEECLKARSLAGESKYPVAFLAYVYGISGQKNKAEELLDQLLKQSEQEYISSYHIALIYCGLNEMDQALKWLNKAYDERDNWMLWLNIYPVFDPLRDDPRFQELVRKVGL
jgi:serine/threonine protein kinase/Tfp pilus assembly protein PilF